MDKEKEAIKEWVDNYLKKLLENIEKEKKEKENNG
jgi:hypothetical protein